MAKDEVMENGETSGLVRKKNKKNGSGLQGTVEER